jgi:hypothetical protein
MTPIIDVPTYIIHQNLNTYINNPDWVLEYYVGRWQLFPGQKLIFDHVYESQGRFLVEFFPLWQLFRNVYCLASSLCSGAHSRTPAAIEDLRKRLWLRSEWVGSLKVVRRKSHPYPSPAQHGRGTPRRKGRRTSADPILGFGDKDFLLFASPTPFRSRGSYQQAGRFPLVSIFYLSRTFLKRQLPMTQPPLNVTESWRMWHIIPSRGDFSSWNDPSELCPPQAHVKDFMRLATPWLIRELRLGFPHSPCHTSFYYQPNNRAHISWGNIIPPLK